MGRRYILLLLLPLIIGLSFVYLLSLKTNNQRTYKMNLSINKYKNMSILDILADPNLNHREYLRVYRSSEFKEMSESLELWEWDTIKKSFERIYSTSTEEQEAKSVFLKNLRHIREHNKKHESGSVSYTLGLNRYFDSDMVDYSDTQYSAYIAPNSDDDDDNDKFGSGSSSETPISIDWRKGILTPPIKYQGDCSSCWAFASTGAIEFHYLIHKHTLLSLSVQQLLDCAHNNGCANGGWPVDAFRHILENSGINLEADYPYEDSTFAHCRYRNSKTRITIEGFGSVDQGSEAHLEEIVATKGPVVVGIDARGDFIFYKSGIFYTPRCSSNFINHAVVVVGYGTENGQEYWLIRNSWGEEWGENGYGRIARNRNNSCGIATKASYPII